MPKQPERIATEGRWLRSVFDDVFTVSITGERDSTLQYDAGDPAHGGFPSKYILSYSQFWHSKPLASK